jgi:hypothetical protein
MGNVVKLFDEDLTADEILRAAEGQFDRVLIVGEIDGMLSVRGNNSITLSEVILWLRKIELKLLVEVE